jgi:glycerol-3-phosphate acyltransferase PlsX
MIIAVDAAGGDYAPNEVIKGAIRAAEENDIEIALVGKKSLIHVILTHYKRKSAISIVDASQVIEADEHPLKAVMSKPDSSIVVGINLLKEGKAQAFVSAGNTGALFGAALLNLGKMEGIERPAICAIMDITEGMPALLIDAGANAIVNPLTWCSLPRWAMLSPKDTGAHFSRIGLLSIGAEKPRNRLVVETHELLKNSNLNFMGNIEANEILKDKADVIVTDGFTGNVVLKTIEGLGDAVQNYKQLWRGINKSYHIHGSTLLNSVGLDSWAKKLDFREYGGACLLGVKGNVIKAHGRSRAIAIKNAINLARQTSEGNIFASISKEDNSGQDSNSNG